MALNPITLTHTVQGDHVQDTTLCDKATTVVRDLRQGSGFLWVPWLPPLKLTAMIHYRNKADSGGINYKTIAHSHS